MAAVIKATCPGCKKVLRVPSDWISQAIRCKNCGLVMTARQPMPATAVKASSTARTTDSAKRPAARRIPTPAPEAIPPLALPVGKLGRWIKGLVILFILVILSGGAIALATPIVWRFWRASPQVAQVQNSESKDNADNDPAVTPSADTVKQPEEPKAPEHKAPQPNRPEPTKPIPGGKSPPDKQPPTPSKPPETKKPEPKPVPATTLFPRRALVVSVHNYLYANPVGAGPPLAGAHNMNYFIARLTNALKIPANQVAHLSDESGRERAHAPVKQVIEQTVADFLVSSRDQDRIMLFLIGHAVEIEGTAYFMPIEGELSDASTLVSLKGILEQMKNSKARQKILVLDSNRFSPTRGLERPSEGPMSAKFDELLKTPPEGVQIWSACVAEQTSFETDSCLAGVFVDSLTAVLEKGIPGPAPQPEEDIPIARMNDLVTAGMKEELTKFKITQTPRLTGKPIAEGAPYDPRAAPPPAPKVAESNNNRMNTRLIQAVLAEIGTPPVKGSQQDETIKFDMLPPFSEKTMKNYDPDDKSDLEKPINDARALLWAISTVPPPASLQAEVQKIRGKSRVNLAMLREGFRSPPNENQFKTQIEKHEREIADLIDDVEQAYKKLTSVEVNRDKEPKRWQANYDFIVARMEAQIAYLYEYQSMLGQMRKELPPLDRSQGNGWKLASSDTLNGDSNGKKKAKSSQALLQKIAEEHKGTPWEVLAKRERLTTLGLEWKTGVVR